MNHKKLLKITKGNFIKVKTEIYLKIEKQIH